MPSPAMLKAMGGGVNKKKPGTYNEQFIRSRVKSGKDERRARDMDKLAQQATEPPHEDDKAALQKLLYASGVMDDPATQEKDGWATADARNYGKFLLSKMNPQYKPQYDEAHDGGGFVRSLGGVIRKAAPLAALIPGVGPLAAGAIAAAANAGGRGLEGDGFDLGSTIKAGALGYGGASLLGGQGVNGIGGIPGKLGGLVKGGIPGMGGGGGPGGGLIGPDGKINPLGAINAIGSVGAAVDSYGRAKSANESMTNARDMAIGAYQRRRPIGDAANAALLSRMGAMGGDPPTDIFSSHFKPAGQRPGAGVPAPMPQSPWQTYGLN